MKPTENDPFAIFTSPPPNETPEERRAREQREIEAKKTSDRIDEEIQAEKETSRRWSPVFKLLVLGQSESGKSTMIRNLRMQWGRTALKAEFDPIRVIIHLKLIRSTITIVEALRAEANGKPIASLLALTSGGEDHRSTSKLSLQPMGCNYQDSDAEVATQPLILLTDKHHVLRMRLSPLRAIEEDLTRMLGEVPEGVMDGIDGMLGRYLAMQERRVEVSGQDSLFERTPTTSTRHDSGNNGKSESGPHVDIMNEITEVILSCRENMKALWEDDAVQAILKKRRIQLEESASSFLNDLDRVAKLDYVPSDDDIGRALPQSRTSWFRGHRIQFDRGNVHFFSLQYIWLYLFPKLFNECIVYETSRIRIGRQRFIPYFGAVNAIIFPISCFDERLPEDPAVNRLEDSFLLWKAVCGSKMLAEALIVLFLNKCDLLEEKLNRGVQVKKFLPSYKERPNEKSEFIMYLTKRFRDIQRWESLEVRKSYIYAISTTDPKAAYFVREAIRDNIMHEGLKKLELL